MFWIGAMALTACMFVSPPRSTEGLPKVEPHAFFNKTENCTCCHETRGEDVEPHAFFVDISETCEGCHDSDMIGRSHPVGIESAEHYPEMEIPAGLPLDADARITCGTCHNPHLAGYSTERFKGGQSPAGTRSENGVQVAYYKSYMLRLHAPEAGNDPTCSACHGEKF